MRKFVFAAVSSAALALSSYSIAHADPAVIELREWKAADATRRAELAIYLSGVYQGFAWANATLQSKGLPRLFCPPERLAVTQAQVVSILDHHIEAGGFGTGERAPLAFTLQMALEEVFSCEP